MTGQPWFFLHLCSSCPQFPAWGANGNAGSPVSWLKLLAPSSHFSFPLFGSDLLFLISSNSMCDTPILLTKRNSPSQGVTSPSWNLKIKNIIIQGNVILPKWRAFKHFKTCHSGKWALLVCQSLITKSETTNWKKGKNKWRKEGIKEGREGGTEEGRGRKEREERKGMREGERAVLGKERTLWSHPCVRPNPLGRFCKLSYALSSYYNSFFFHYK